MFLGQFYPTEDIDDYKQFDSIVHKKFIFNCLVSANSYLICIFFFLFTQFFNVKFIFSSSREPSSSFLVPHRPILPYRVNAATPC